MAENTEERELHNATVLMSSGDVDEWEDIADAVMDPELGGALMIVAADDKVAALYAPGMWMKVEYDQ